MVKGLAEWWKEHQEHDRRIEQEKKARRAKKEKEERELLIQLAGKFGKKLV